MATTLTPEMRDRPRFVGVAVRLPPEIVAAADAEAAERGVSRGEVIRDMLRAGFNARPRR